MAQGSKGPGILHSDKEGGVTCGEEELSKVHYVVEIIMVVADMPSSDDQIKGDGALSK